jgi:hypothetical protein
MYFRRIIQVTRANEEVGLDIVNNCNFLYYKYRLRNYTIPQCYNRVLKIFVTRTVNKTYWLPLLHWGWTQFSPVFHSEKWHDNHSYNRHGSPRILKPCINCECLASRATLFHPTDSAPVSLWIGAGCYLQSIWPFWGWRNHSWPRMESNN